ncbi:hypothetical protein BN1723_007902, partial [Verticillium longisporum]
IEATTRVRRAIIANDASLVKRILNSNPQALHSPDASPEGLSNSNLHLAAFLGHVEVCRVLIDLGHEDPDPALNEKHQTALMLAAGAGRTEVVHLLCERYPKVIHRRDAHRRDAIMEASRGGHDTVLQILLTYAPNGPEEAVQTADLDGNTALHFASGNGNLLVLRTLLAAGADAERRNKWSWTALSYSATVQAEVYLKGLVTEIERRKVVRRETEGQKKGGAAISTGTSGVTRHSPDKLDSHQRPGSRGSSLPYPATKLIIGQYLYLSTRPRFWAWLIVGTFYDKDNHKVWSTEIFAIHNDPRGYSPETREFDEGQQPPEHLLHPNTTLHPQNNNNTSFVRAAPSNQRHRFVPRPPSASTSNPFTHQPLVLRPARSSYSPYPPAPPQASGSWFTHYNSETRRWVNTWRPHPN